MITISKVEKSKIGFNNTVSLTELRGLSTDTKPTQIGSKKNR